MSISLKSAAIVAVVLGGAALGAGSASALPLVGLDPAVAAGADLAPQIQDARWMCGPFRCRWAPNYWYGPRFFHPRRFYYRRFW